MDAETAAHHAPTRAILDEAMAAVRTAISDVATRHSTAGETPCLGCIHSSIARHLMVEVLAGRTFAAVPDLLVTAPADTIPAPLFDAANEALRGEVLALTRELGRALVSLQQEHAAAAPPSAPGGSHVHH